MALFAYYYWNFDEFITKNDDSFIKERTNFFEPTTPPQTKSLELKNFILPTIAAIFLLKGIILSVFGEIKRRNLTDLDESTNEAELRALDDAGETLNFISSKSKRFRR